MKIRKHYSLAHSDKLMTILAKKIAAVKPVAIREITKETYSNGREHGYCLQVYPKVGFSPTSIVFAQQRNSDSIVVYCLLGKYVCFDGNIPSEEVYRSGMCFPTDEAAADHIIQLVIAIDKGRTV